tara:strand:- start:1012 stop:1746 length:735 start_codon:yes stop_codon:yes gene_type:complete
MTYLYSKALIKNIYKKPNSKSEVTSQIIYGEKIKVLKKRTKWSKIKTTYDNYIGYVKNNKLTDTFFISHKSFLLKTKIYNNNFKLNGYLPFNSRIGIKNFKNGYGKFDNNKWVKLKEVKRLSFIERDFFKIVNKFLKSKYLWGGKTYKGIDCSALIQLFFMFNNKYFPRDTKDQIKFSKRKLFNKKFRKGDIIYWKGHVAICIDKKRLIHAYGPKKKVIIMNIENTINLIENTAKLKVKKISKI